MSESIQPHCTIHFSVIMMCVGCVSLTLFPLLELICLIYGDIKGRLPLLYTNLKIIEVIALILCNVTTTAIVIIINVSPSFLIRVTPHPPLHHSMKLGNHFFEDDVYFSQKNLIQNNSVSSKIHYNTHSLFMDAQRFPFKDLSCISFVRVLCKYSLSSVERKYRKIWL